MKVMNLLDTGVGVIFVNIVLTEEETKRLQDGKVINNDDDDKAGMKIQIVGYGNE